MTPQTHTDRDYEKELKQLQTGLQNMAKLVEDMLDLAIDGLFGHNVETAKLLIVDDHKVNQAELDLDNLCLRILVRRQPMATDLRVITRTLKMVTDLERIGDLAVNIGERIVDLETTGWIEIPPSLREMAAAGKGMVIEAIRAFVENDASLARAVLAKDDEIDRLYKGVFIETLQAMTVRAENVHALIHVQSVAKYLERVGDHATNLAEQVVFVVRGEELRHTGHL
jgi:phosphate transport system protein